MERLKKVIDALGRSRSGTIGRKKDLGTQLAVHRAGQGWTRDQITKEWNKIKNKDVNSLKDYVKDVMKKEAKMERLKKAIENARKDEQRVTMPSRAAYDRMDGMTDITAQKNFDKAVKVMTKDLYDEAWEDDEVAGFFAARAVNVMKTVKR
jgi:uncharacterized protein (DUF433 family)